MKPIQRSTGAFLSGTSWVELTVALLKAPLIGIEGGESNAAVRKEGKTPLLGYGELGDRIPLIGGGELLRPKGASFRARNDALATFVYFPVYLVDVRCLGAQGISWDGPLAA
jgi:hypothetical protein